MLARMPCHGCNYIHHKAMARGAVTQAGAPRDRISRAHGHQRGPSLSPLQWPHLHDIVVMCMPARSERHGEGEAETKLHSIHEGGRENGSMANL